MIPTSNFNYLKKRNVIQKSLMYTLCSSFHCIVVCLMYHFDFECDIKPVNVRDVICQEMLTVKMIVTYLVSYTEESRESRNRLKDSVRQTETFSWRISQRNFSFNDVTCCTKQHFPDSFSKLIIILLTVKA